jgi:hypothetical protein
MATARGPSLAMPVCQRNLTDSDGNHFGAFQVQKWAEQTTAACLTRVASPGKMHPGSEARITLELIGQTWSNSILSLTDGLLGDVFWKR